MTCPHCVNRVKQALYALEGVSRVEVSLEEEKVQVFTDRDVPSDLLRSAIEEWGYRVLGEI